jgi:hypothetical protein
MRALSIHQPWAELIMLGRKRYELRTWKTGFRGQIAVHASFGMDHRLDDYEGARQAGLPIEKLERGAIVGTVELVDCTPFARSMANEMLANRAHFSGWLQNLWAWELQRPERLRDPVPYRGRQGLFRIPDLVQYDTHESGVPGIARMGRFWIVTNKLPPTSGVLGRRVWLIVGEGIPRRYYLRQTFITDEIQPAPIDGFEHLVRGRHGRRFRALRIDTEPWFREFQRSQGNFAFGLNPIREEFADEFDRLAQQSR